MVQLGLATVRANSGGSFAMAVRKTKETKEKESGHESKW